MNTMMVPNSISFTVFLRNKLAIQAKKLWISTNEFLNGTFTHTQGHSRAKIRHRKWIMTTERECNITTNSFLASNKHSLMYLIHTSDTDCYRLGTSAAFDLVEPANGCWVLCQASNTVYCVCRYSNDTTITENASGYGHQGRVVCTRETMQWIHTTATEMLRYKATHNQIYLLKKATIQIRYNSD